MYVMMNGREMSWTEKYTCDSMKQALPGQSFALVGDRTVVAVIDEYETAEEVAEAARRIMEEYLGMMPDFTPYVLNKIRCAVILQRFCVTIEDMTPEEAEKEEVDFGHALEMRAKCLEACERGEVRAVYMPEEEWWL